MRAVSEELLAEAWRVVMNLLRGPDLAASDERRIGPLARGFSSSPELIPRKAPRSEAQGFSDRQRGSSFLRRKQRENECAGRRSSLAMHPGSRHRASGLEAAKVARHSGTGPGVNGGPRSSIPSVAAGDHSSVLLELSSQAPTTQLHICSLSPECR